MIFAGSAYRPRAFVPALTLSGFLLVACGGQGSNTPLAPIAAIGTSTSSPTPAPTATPPAVPSSLSLFAGAASTFSVVAPPGQTVTYSVTNPAVASVTALGGSTFSIAALAPGTTTITFIDSQGVLATVTMVVAPSAPVLNPTSIALLGAGSTQNFTATEPGYSGTFSVVSSSAPGVATVTQTTPGVFTATAVSAGTTTVTIGDTGGRAATIVIGVTVNTITVL